MALRCVFDFRGRAAQKGPAAGREPCAPTGMDGSLQAMALA